MGVGRLELGREEIRVTRLAHSYVCVTPNCKIARIAVARRMGDTYLSDHSRVGQAIGNESTIRERCSRRYIL